MKKKEKNTHIKRHGSVMRLSGMIKKEILQIIRDPSSIATAFVLPLILLLIFGYGVSLDAKDVPMAIVANHQTPVTASLTGALLSSRYFDAKKISTMHEAENMVMTGQVDGIIWLRGNFTKDVLSGKTASIAVFVNGVDANNGRIIEGYVQGVWAKWLASFARARGLKLSMPVNVKYRVWFNPAVRSRNFLVPGLIAIIMTLIGALLTALVIAREWERGTMEALFVTPIRVGEILLGKLIPYFVLGMCGLVMSVAIAIWLFKVPLMGSLLVLMTTSALFLLAALGMGLLISTLSKNQFVAGQTAIITTYLPAFILSGFIFDIGSMPEPIRVITHVVAARYYVSILQTVFSAGDIMAVIIPNSLALLAMAVFFLGLVRIKTKKRLMA